MIKKNLGLIFCAILIQFVSLNAAASKTQHELDREADLAARLALFHVQLQHQNSSSSPIVPTKISSGSSNKQMERTIAGMIIESGRFQGMTVEQAARVRVLKMSKEKKE